MLLAAWRGHAGATASANARHADRRTPLHNARSAGVAAALLAAGARTAAADKHQLRPLHTAARADVASHRYGRRNSPQPH